MAFYYTSLFSIVPLGLAYGFLALLFAGAVRATRGVRGRGAILSVLGFVFLLLPVGEEFLIAWNFGQACKEAGTFINKKVQVEGFYDDTSHWWRQLKENSNYQFVESRDQSNGTLWRVERHGEEIKHFRIDRPTARYHFRMPSSHAPIGYKIVKHETVVLDTVAGDQLGRYTRISRTAPWFYWSIRGDFSCDAPGQWPLATRDFLIFENVLIPAGKK